MQQTPGKIFLADQRGTSETTLFSRFSTFNYGDFYQKHKQPMGNLFLLNEETLAGSQSIKVEIDQNSHLVIFPLTGAVQVQTAEQNLVLADVGEVPVITVPAKTFICLKNPYEADSIHFLLLGIKAAQSVIALNHPFFPFNFTDIENQLAPIIAGSKAPYVSSKLPFTLSLGRLAGRQETTFYLQEKKSICFIFVLTGAFEAQGRLLHEKDGLALWDTDEVELEALSNNALVLVLELKPT
ncbi:hypothetical protein AHMF7605_00120 [Adhaeribacter arboris]|uniref:Quercetin 2,3-dioxygenase C-terminal cupin domain-containing protein n=1 Tax=Adhaeribacter arboris TaxID=2072846 RepID=A0A2T2Y945_9BACT|nr:hypothetical protein [Adhaeribacter arboris]PSR52034.1 hypothetical protein AHMF7605_00120 [Adhaeribacter arboris]